MLREWFDAGGPVMYALLVLWVLQGAAVLDRLLYGAGRFLRRPAIRVSAQLSAGRLEEARELADAERGRARRGLERIDGISQLATSVGLFGTVLGLARSFFSRGSELGLAAPEVLASGLSTALYTTVAGLFVFLVGQGFLVLYREWLAHCEAQLGALPQRAVGEAESA